MKGSIKINSMNRNYNSTSVAKIKRSNSGKISGSRVAVKRKQRKGFAILLILLVLGILFLLALSVYIFSLQQQVSVQQQQLGIKLEVANLDLTATTSTTRSKLLVQAHPPDGVPFGAQRLENNNRKQQKQDKNKAKLQSPIENNNDLPEWLEEYLLWHRQQRALLNETNWKVFRYLVMKCMTNQTCGGVTDRLRPVPVMVRIAHDTNRIFLIKWSNPNNLEEYLLPPIGGLDWRVPEWLAQNLRLYRPRQTWNGYLKPVLKDAQREGRVSVVKFQSWNHGFPYYDEQVEQNNKNLTNTTLTTYNNKNRMEYPLHMHGTYRKIWDAVFTPSLPVAKLIEDQMDSMGLRPGEYTVTHVRAFYGKSTNTPEKIEELVKNAINCTSLIYSNSSVDHDEEEPIYFASDSFDAMEMAKKYGKETNYPIVVKRRRRQQQEQQQQHPLHVGKSSNYTDPSDFYETFIDIYLIGQSRCSCYGGSSGFGKWGLILGYNSSCQINHFGQKGRDCDLIKRKPHPGLGRQKKTKQVQKQGLKLQQPLFLKPMM